jgi:acetyl-CoA C-acetyltransferase
MTVDKGVTPNIDGIFVANAGSDLLNGQANIGALVADHSGLGGKPAFKIEASGASGGFAIAQAYMAIASGIMDTVAVVGVEKMTDQVRSSAIVSLQSSNLDAEWESLNGLTEAGVFGMIAQAYFQAYPHADNRKWIASVSAKNHNHAVFNKNAHFRRAFTIDQILKSSMVAEPLTLLDCSPASDGAAAVILTKADLASNFTDSPVWIKGIGMATDTMALHDRADLTSFSANKSAGKQAYEMANLKASDINVAEIYDNYSITEVVTLEDLGFFEPGKAGIASFEGKTTLNTPGLVTSPSGGLKAMGHPIGATGVAQAAEIFWQLRGEAQKERQVKDAKNGLTHCLGGSGSSVSVNIFSI